MPTLCSLYGHRWRHPGEYEVIVTPENGAVHRFTCDACGRDRLLDPNRRDWLEASSRSASRGRR